MTRRYAVKCLGILCNTDFKSTVITRLSEIMEDPDYRVRLSVLAQMDAIRRNDEQYFCHILQKANVDNNFIISSWIRNNYINN